MDDDVELANLRDAALEGAAVREQPDVPLEVRRQLPEQAPKALETFFDVYFGRVYGYVRRLVRDEHLTEDLTQEIFLHVFRALPSYDPDRELRPWVFTIATNKNDSGTTFKRNGPRSRSIRSWPRTRYTAPGSSFCSTAISR